MLYSETENVAVQFTCGFKMDQNGMVTSLNAAFKSKRNVVVLSHRKGRILTPVNHEKVPTPICSCHFCVRGDS